MKIADLRYHGWALAAATLAGCAVAPSPNQVPPLSPRTGGAHTLASYVYSGECCRFANSGGNVTLYDAGLAGVVRRITKGITTPGFMTIDGSGRLYVIMDQDYDGVVTEYDYRALSPSRRIEKNYAWSAATDGSNNLYVASCPSCHPYGNGSGSVDVYEAGTTKLLRTITKGIDVPLSVAVDTKDNLYVADGAYAHPVVAVYAPGASKPLRKLTQGLTSPSQVVLDPSNDVFVLNNGGTGAQFVVEYEAESGKLLRTIRSGVQSPQAIVTDGSGTLYVANANGYGHGWVSVYPPDQARRGLPGLVDGRCAERSLHRQRWSCEPNSRSPRRLRLRTEHSEAAALRSSPAAFRLADVVGVGPVNLERFYRRG